MFDPSRKPQVPLDQKALKHKAIELLARREYSYGELEAKLLPRAEDESQLYSVLDWLVEMGLQSDSRFTEMYIRSKALSGYGPVRIRMELKQKHISDSQMEMGFEILSDELDWHSEVLRLIEKKTKNMNLAEPKDKNKVLGFLQRRGFNLDQIYKALSEYQLEGE